MIKIGIFNQKGGVGKTTTALNLAGAFYAQQHAVTMLDLDPQGHLTGIFKRHALDPNKHLYQFYQADIPLVQLLQTLQPNMHLLAANAELMKVDSYFGRGPNILKKLSQGLASLAVETPDTALIVDCCPYIGVISLNAIFACDLMIVPVASDYFSVGSAIKVERALRALEPVLKRRVERRYLLTRADKRKKMTSEVERELRALFGDEVLETKISENIALAESPRLGKNVFEYDKSSPGARDYAQLLMELKANVPMQSS